MGEPVENVAVLHGGAFADVGDVDPSVRDNFERQLKGGQLGVLCRIGSGPARL